MSKDWDLDHWENEFDRRFGNNFVYWQEIVAEIRIGDPDFGGLKRFIKECIEKAKQSPIEVQP
jgi:hypothetical protein